MGVPGCGLVGLDGRHVHDAAAGISECIGGGPGEEVGGTQVDVVDGVPVGGGHVGEGGDRLQGGIVDEHVEPTSGVEGRRHEPFGAVGVSEVRYDAGAGQGFEAVDSVVDAEHQVGAEVGQATGDGGADGAVGAGHEGDAAVQAEVLPVHRTAPCGREGTPVRGSRRSRRGSGSSRRGGDMRARVVT